MKLVAIHFFLNFVFLYKRWYNLNQNIICPVVIDNRWNQRAAKNLNWRWSVRVLCLHLQITFWCTGVNIWKPAGHSGNIKAVPYPGSVLHARSPSIVDVVKSSCLQSLVWQGPRIDLSHHSWSVHLLTHTPHWLWNRWQRWYVSCGANYPQLKEEGSHRSQYI